MERRPYICPEEIIPTEFSLWPVAGCCAFILMGAFLEFALHIQYATTAAGLVVIVGTCIAAHFMMRNKLSTFPCSHCGATSLEQSEDDENILLICHSCRIEWVTNLGIGKDHTEHTDW